MLESLGRLPEGGVLDLAHLLPQLTRARLYTFPYPAGARDLPPDCNWTTFNFFIQPDSQLRVEEIPRFIQRSTPLEVVAGAPQFGDIITIETAAGQVVHSAVDVADDLVFTKNGSANTQPFILMRMDELLKYYGLSYAPDQGLHLKALRRPDPDGR